MEVVYYPAVMIDWEDHASFSESKWRDVSDIERIDPVIVTTVGFLVRETKDAYTVVSTLTDNQMGCGEFLILKGTVKSIKELWA